MNITAGIELYDRERFFTITGKRFEGTPPDIRECNGPLTNLHRAVFGDGTNPKAKPCPKSKAPFFSLVPPSARGHVSRKKPFQAHSEDDHAAGFGEAGHAAARGSALGHDQDCPVVRNRDGGIIEPVARGV